MRKKRGKRRSTRSTWAGILAVMVTCALGPTARAQDEPDESGESADGRDYDVNNKEWNGLYTLAAVAKGVGLTVEQVDEIEWTDLGTGDILFILYPTVRLEPGHVSGFVRNGGHVLIADDFGQSNEALGRLGGMLRGRAIGVSARRFYRDLQYVPMARPLIPEHPLAQRVEELATNHPSKLTEVSGPDVVFGFNDAEGVVVAGELGNGRFVVCSDPSVFINRMMQFEGNLEFAFNVFRYLRRGDASRRLVILTGDFDMYGEPTQRMDDDTVRGSVSNMLGDFNRWLDERNDYLLTEPGMRAVAFILAALIGLFALLSLPLARRSRMDGSWTRARSSTSVGQHDFEYILARYDRKRSRAAAVIPKSANYVLPAAILRDGVDSCLARILQTDDPLSRPDGDISIGILAARGQMAASAFERLNKRLKPLPTRARAASPWSTDFMSQRDFELLHEDAMELYLALGEEPG